MKKLIAKIYSYIPILSITDDNNFGTNELCENASYRFSLFNLFLGHICIYFITYNITNKKFSFAHKIIMEQSGDLKNKCKPEKIDKKVENYIFHLNQISNEDLIIEKDFINYLNDRECGRIALSERKINLYTTIILAIIPLFIAFFDIKTFFNYSWYAKIISVFEIYSLLNVVLFVFNSMKVSGLVLSKFSELRTAKNKTQTSISNYYFDWQMYREKADIWVSYVKNIEYWIKIGIICAIILTITVNIGTTIKIKTLNDNYIHSSEMVLTTNIDELKEPYSNSSIAMAELHLKIQKKQIKRLLIIVPSEDYIDNIFQEFKPYGNKLLVKCYLDNTLKDNNEIKIIEE